jgi:uncharacterized OsmC-like protein
MTATSNTTLNDVDIATVGGLAQAIADNPDRGATRWAASVEWRGGFRSQSSIREFGPLDSDEPRGLGGTDTAPNPVEQLLAALGNCLAVGFAANASAAGVELGHLRLDVEGDLDLHTFLGLRPGHAGFDAIRVTVHIESDASPDQIEELRQRVVRTSPVGHTLERAIPVSYTIA